MHSKGNRSSNGNVQPKSACSPRNIIIAIASIAIAWSVFISLKINMGKSVLQPTLITDNVEVENHVEPLAERIEVESDEDNLHVVFSTDCTFFQDWQSLVMFYSAVAIGQKGPITRIASGCNSQKKEVLTKLYAKLFPQYFVHFTPDFKTDKATSESYEFYNKPYGVEHWLDNAEPPVPDGVVIAIVDPDMMFIRPLTTKIQTPNSLFMPGSSNIPLKVAKGYPSGQLYGLGAPWADATDKNFNRTEVCEAGSPCLKVTEKYGDRFYRYAETHLQQQRSLI